MKECVNNYKLARIFKQRRTYLQTCSVGVDPHLPTPSGVKLARLGRALSFPLPPALFELLFFPL